MKKFLSAVFFLAVASGAQANPSYDISCWAGQSSLSPLKLSYFGFQSAASKVPIQGVVQAQVFDPATKQYSKKTVHVIYQPTASVLLENLREASCSSGAKGSLEVNQYAVKVSVSADDIIFPDSADGPSAKQAVAWFLCLEQIMTNCP